MNLVKGGLLPFEESRSDMYTNFYRFSEKPFEDTPDPKFLYLTPTYQKALASIKTWVKEDHRLAAITGEAGTGKTLLIYALLNHLDEKIKTVMILNPTMTFKDLLKQILLELGEVIREKSTEGLLHQFLQYLDQIKAKNQTLLIIFDEAQDFSEQTLEDLHHFFNPELKLIHIIFVGQPGFQHKLNSPGLRNLGQRIKIRHHMRSFTDNESHEYMDHRLRLAGSSSEIFTPKAIAMIHRYTQGTPSLINHVCDNAFRIGYTLKRGKIDLDIIQKVIQNLEGPKVTPKIMLPIQALSKIWSSPIRFTPLLKRVSMAILLLVCLGGLFVLLYEYRNRASMKSQEKKSFIELKSVTQPLTHTSPPKGTTDKISLKDATPPSVAPKLTTPESSTLRPDATPPISEREKERLTEIIVVKSGQTLSSLAKKYYNLANATLVDLILKSNPEITNAHLITVDQKIRIPKMTEESLVIQSPDRTYKIHVGTFWTPDAPKLYGDEPALKGKTIEIIPRKVSPTDMWFQVLVGSFKNREEALRMVSHLKEKGLLPSLGGSSKKD